jgi:hypothetical protein
MGIFLNRHWKKILLSLTAAFWASCETESIIASDNGDEKDNVVVQTSSSVAKDASSSSKKQNLPVPRR